MRIGKTHVPNVAVLCHIGKDSGCSLRLKTRYHELGIKKYTLIPS